MQLADPTTKVIHADYLHSVMEGATYAIVEEQPALEAKVEKKRERERRQMQGKCHYDVDRYEKSHWNVNYRRILKEAFNFNCNDLFEYIN